MTRFTILSFVIVSFVVSSTQAFASPYSDAVLSNNPVLYWQLDDAGGGGSTVADSSAGGTRTGTVGAGGPNFGQTSAAPNLGTAVQWTGPDAGNGSTKRITFDAANPELINLRPPSVNKSTTVEYWVNFTQTGSGGDNTWTNPSILGNESGGDGDMYWGNINNTGQFRMSTSDIREIRVDGLNDGNWHHIMMVKNWDTGGPSSSAMYVDGGALAGGLTFLADTAGGNASYQDGDSQITALGLTQDGGGGNVQFQGLLDELAIYNTALTEADAAAHFAAATAVAIPEPATFALAGVGLLALLALSRRRRQRT